MSKKSFQENEPRVPERAEGIQVNSCKNPLCANFNVEPLLYKYNNKNDSNGQSKVTQDPNYTIAAYGKQLPVIKCKACNEFTPIKSNQGIFEEKSRLGAYLTGVELTCPNIDCGNHHISVSTLLTAYYRVGTTNNNQRYQCKLCKKTFSTGNKRRKQLRPEINKQLYINLVNKAPVNRCCEMLGIRPQTYYDKVDWLYEQALGFVHNRERKLFKNFETDRLYLSTDRQVHNSNWLSRDDKRNTELLAIGTADNRSGYVFGWHFNFDPTMNPATVEQETLLLNDYDKKVPQRKHARLWLERDFEKAQQASLNNKTQPQGSLIGDVAEKYNAEQGRYNPEAAETVDNTVKPPNDGMLVHSEYTMSGHFHLLNDMLSNVGKVRFYLDQEAGIKNAFMSSFGERVLGNTADAFYVRASKGLTINQKEALIHECHLRIRAMTGASYRKMSAEAKEQAVLRLIMEEMGNLVSFPNSPERWLRYPFATKPEPEKLVAAITDISGLSEIHQARLYKNASLHGIDRFFMQARRRMYLFERPFNSGSNASRTWYGYSPYNPENYIKMAELFRLFYNYIHVGDRDGKTPAMRLVLAKGPVSYEKIIYYDQY